MKIAVSQSFAGRLSSAVAICGGLALATAAAVSGAPRTRITPYLEVQQVLSADFNGGDVLTYTGVGGGVDGTIATRRVQATISYNYQHRIGWGDKLDDGDVHSGLARVHADVVPGTVTFDAGALATRSHADLRFPTPALRTVNDTGVAEIYSAYAGPTLTTHAGPVTVGASYRLGYVHVDDHSLAGALPPGQKRADRYRSSTVQNAAVSAGMAPGELPFGWTVGAGWSHEDTNRLDSSFDGKFVRGDVVLPVTPTLALTAGAGYEDIRSSQQDIVRDAAGLPVIGPNGDVIADPTKPRRLAYDQSGLIYDAGVIWRPSPRTELQARVGRRYGGTTFTGSLQHRINESYALSASVYDSVDSFGRLLVTDLNGVPRNFNIRRGPFDDGLGGVGGCVFGTEPGTGACFADALQSVNSFNFRNRGASVMLSGGRGPWTFGLGAGFNQRRYFAPPAGNFILEGVTDESVTLNASGSRRFTASSGVNVDAFAGWFDSGIAGADSSFSTGVTGNYYRSIFDPRLQATIGAGIYSVDSGGRDQTVGSVLFGLKFSF